MKKSFVKTYIIFLILLFIFFIVFIMLKNGNKNSQSQSVTKPPIVANAYETKIDSKGNMGVEVTPKILSKTDNSSFEVSINNHQVNLNYNLAKIAVLTDDKGNKYTPISWNGPEGGHHSVGILVFPKLSKDVSSITLFLPKIGGVDRSFSWKL